MMRLWRPSAQMLRCPQRPLLPTSIDWMSRYFSSNPLVVTILGPPNAGKSTLYNRLQDAARNRTYKLNHAKQNSRSAGPAIVTSLPGTTRDRRTGWARLGSVAFELVDTAGLDTDRITVHNNNKEWMEHAMRHQCATAVAQAHVTLLLFDGRVSAAAMASDVHALARWWRKQVANHRDQNKYLLVGINKLEGGRRPGNTDSELEEAEWLTLVQQLGAVAPPLYLSAAHGEGMADLALELHRIQQELGLENPIDEETEKKNQTIDSKGEKPLQLAILGRPNVGKSTLVNQLIGEERVIAGPMPGLTRDSIAINHWSWKGRPVQLVDTAGLRKVKSRPPSAFKMDEQVLHDLDQASLADALRALETADVAVLVLDGQAQKLQRQELAIAQSVIQHGRALVVVANKMDLVVDEEYSVGQYEHDVRQQLEGRMPALRMTPIVPMSSLEGTNVHRLMPVVFQARDRWAQTISTGKLNAWLSEVTSLTSHRPPTINGLPAKLKYMIQTKGRPPTFLLFCNVSSLPEPYLRFLQRHFQDSFSMYGMAVRIRVQKDRKKHTAVAKRNGGNSISRTGFGLGGRAARKERKIKQLKSHGKPAQRRRKKFKR